MAFTNFPSLSNGARASLFTASISAVFAFSMAFAMPALAYPPQSKDASATTETSHDSMGNMAGMKGMMGDHDDSKAGAHEHAAENFSFGFPSPNAKPDQVIQISALDSMSYDPPKITVDAGSVVKFVVTNKGEIAHAWAIDTVQEQLEHEAGMENVDMSNMMTHMDSEPNGFVLKPGETKTLVWTFTKGGDIQYACHLPGHYGAGMHGTVAVKGGDKMKSGHHGGMKMSHGSGDH